MSDIQKVYIVTCGSYSDYHICGVALDREAAEKLAKLHTTQWEEADVEEWDLSGKQSLPEKLLPVWEITVYRGGETECDLYGYSDASADHIQYLKLNTNYSENYPAPLFTEMYDDNYLLFQAKIMTEDKELAQKIAWDKRAELLNQYLMEHGDTHREILEMIKKHKKEDWKPMPLACSATFCGDISKVESFPMSMITKMEKGDSE